MIWVQLALALVKLADLIFKKFNEQALIQVGEDRAQLKQLREMTAVSAKLKEVQENFDKLSVDQIKAELEAKGDFRD